MAALENPNGPVFTEASDDELLDLLDDLACKQSSVAEARLTVLREIEIREIAALDGHRSTAVWLAHRHRISRGKANTDLRTARALHKMPEISMAFRAGQITEAHVSRFLKVCRPEVAALFARDEELLLSKACELSFKAFCQALRYWELRADPNKGDDDTQRAHDARSAHMSRVGEEWYLDAKFDLIAGAEFAEALARFEKEQFEIDWALAKETHGEDVSLADLARTHAQRRSDALLEIARRACAAAANSKSPEPLVNIVMDSKTFLAESVKYFVCDSKIQSLHKDSVCELIDGTPITPRAAFEQAVRGRIARIVFDSPSVVAEMGKPKRFFTGTLRRALIVRDRTCTWPGCQRRAQRCELDHIIDVADGGPTTERNGHCLCALHHKLKHSNKFTVSRDPNGELQHKRADGSPINKRPPPLIPYPEETSPTRASPDEQQRVSRNPNRIG